VVKEQGGNGHMASLQTLNNFTKVTLQKSEDMKYLKILSTETNRTVNKIYLHITRFMVCIHVRRQVVTAMGSWAFAPWLLVCKRGVSDGAVKATGTGDTPLEVFLMPHVCGLSFAIRDVQWLLVCKRGVSEVGGQQHGVMGHSPIWVFPMPGRPWHVCGMGVVASRLLSWVHPGSWSAIKVLGKERRRVVALLFHCCLCLSEVDWEEGGVGLLTNVQKYTMTNDEFHLSFVVWLPHRCWRHGTWILYERCEWGEVSHSPWLLVACVCSWVLASFVFILGPSLSFGQASSSFVGGHGWRVSNVLAPILCTWYGCSLVCCSG